LRKDDKVTQLQTYTGQSAEVTEFLRRNGYEITEGAKLLGKSGIEHTFDMLAEWSDGFISHTIAMCIVAWGSEETELDTIFSFANKAYDSGVYTRVLIAASGLSQEGRLLAQKRRVKVIDGNHELLDLNGTRLVKPNEPFKLAGREQLVQYLVNVGYTVEENAKVQGRSGIEYTFIIMAHIDDDLIGHNLCIDVLIGEEEVGLGQVSLFDTKADDVGIDNKIIVVSPGLSPEARRFAHHQQIQILEIGQESDFESWVSPKNPAQLPERPTKLAEVSPQPSKSKTKPLKLMSEPEALRLIPEVMVRRYNAIPLSISGNTLRVAMADQTDIFALEAFSAQTQKRIKTVTASAEEIREAIDFNYKGYGEIEKCLSHISITDDTVDERIGIDTAVDAPVAQVLNLIINEAVKDRSSDIHIEPEESRTRVRYRIDGTLQDMMSLPPNIHRSLISRIKILADMNIADHHHPLDGQFSTEAKGRQIDIRVATVPTVTGEMAVLRLLDKSRAILGLSDLGLLEDSLAKYQDLLKVPYGMILSSGPTGAGKTTTLYASINSLDTIGRNIVTIEDPAEYRFKDINQIQVNRQAGITFATGLKSILRLDPDVILVGEVRDAETADISIQSALTGHLVLSSIHANNAAGALSRLVDLGVEPFLLTSAVIGVAAQRMVRCICPDCSHSIEAPVVERIAYEKQMGEEKTEFLYGTGCKSCAYTGYLGRTAIIEILAMSDSMRKLISNQAAISDIQAQAYKDGMISMLKDGMRKVKLGITTPAEVLRSVYSSE